MLEAAARAVGRECDFIFHIGHVGSTLIARLLGRHHRVFALREPALLRSAAVLRAEAGFSNALLVMLKLYARVWRPGQRSLVKATSFVADLGSEALDCFPSAKATLIVTAPKVFIASPCSQPPLRKAKWRPRAGPAKCARSPISPFAFQTERCGSILIDFWRMRLSGC